MRQPSKRSKFQPIEIKKILGDLSTICCLPIMCLIKLHRRCNIENIQMNTRGVVVLIEFYLVYFGIDTVLVFICISHTGNRVVRTHGYMKSTFGTKVTCLEDPFLTLLNNRAIEAARALNLGKYYCTLKQTNKQKQDKTFHKMIT